MKLIGLFDEFLNTAALRTFNRYAALLAGATLSFLLVRTFFFHPVDHDLKKIFSEKSKGAALEKMDDRPVNEKPYSFYSEQITGKVLFTASSKPSSSSSQDGGSPLKNIALVGILPGDNPQAVLEDQATQKTYYLSKNQSLNNMTVKDIRDNAVVLEYNGETETLTL